ncbi:MAG: bifunctional diaminohydroxyphosphoribosylaminopyrimidine deaminase/5-amino-6-(5-phosphoribosylamino)uracil reductase RibD [Zoogloeaceae bacterium]|jgi:diaminohydroxyphosphoribosylaminopyrimidine deaminase/5-amino-6-(5-phosphoribosylamino)uracil reductase|nr:bifunctional diaminohydroxyphosphoribosylaminopyrimidine deaminase/5-amino-6-(5-phosphoribosylamino)uracil reductase RibD [Zoogloeaceae bacterium]
MTFTAADHDFMARALRLAEQGLFTTTPNPRVGCVLVRDGAVVGEGWHARAGGAHAEIHALDAAGGHARGATAYVTLEPCSHHGRTPPCADALIAAGAARVVVAMRDPNPQVGGKGIEKLRAAGIAVDEGLMASEARELNIGFVSRMERGRPWVRAKLAASLDGKTALVNGQSQWITGPEARRDGHVWRARACAILTGAGTVREDDPRLTARDVDTDRQPLRVVVDSHYETPPTARILAGGNALVAVAREDAAKAAALRAAGAEVTALPDPRGKVDLPRLLRLLAERGVNELHVEAGHRLNGALLSEGLIDELLLYFAPTILGSGREMFPLPEIADLAGRRDLSIIDLRRVGNDIRVLARPLA